MLQNGHSFKKKKTLYTLQFADDQVVLAGDKDDLEYMMRKLKET